MCFEGYCKIRLGNLVLHMSDVPFLMLIFQIMASLYDGKNVQSVIFNASTFISQNLFFETTVFLKICEMSGVII